MAGLPDYSDNPVTSGNYGQNGNQSMEVALAAKMQLILDQPMADVDSALTNRDFEGEFFKIGDTVAIVKPNIDSLTIATGTISTKNTNDPYGKPLVGGAGADAAERYSNKDARLIPQNVDFSKRLMTIDTYKKYAFYISDLDKAEGKWNYESGNHALVARRLRIEHNMETVQMIINDAAAGVAAAGDADATTNPKDHVRYLGTPANPIVCANGKDIYKKVVLPIFSKLYNAGAITADGQVTYGSNAQQGKSTAGAVFVPTEIYTELLASEYLQDRSTVAADEKVQSGKFKTLMGLDFAIEPSLDLDNDEIDRKVSKSEIQTASGETLESGVLCIVAGTSNLVTKAGKVLPPEKLRSHKFFADEFHGMEIYHKEVIEPKAGVVAFVKISAGE